MMSFSLSGGVEIFGFISPSEPTDQYPVIDPLYGIDGLRNVPTTSDLNAIPDLRRRAGMVVGVNDGSTYYRLLPGPWNGTITDWTVFQTGGGSVFTGGTVTGATIFLGGLTATTFSASTYLGLPLDVFVTGGTYSNGTLTFTNNSGGTFNVSGLTEPFTGGTVSGATEFTNGLTANTISATTYLNLPLDINVTGGTYSAGTITFTNNSGGTFDVTGLTTGSTSTISGDYLPLSGGTVSGDTNFTNGLTANTFSASSIFVNGVQNIPLSIFKLISKVNSIKSCVTV